MVYGGKRKYQGKKAKAIKRGRYAASVARAAGQTVVARPSTVAAVIRQIGELKGVDTNIGASDVVATTSTNDNITVLNLIQPGAGSYNRIGRKVTISSVRVWGTVRNVNAAAASTGALIGNGVRLLVVWDHQPSGTLPAFNEICGHTDQSGTEASSYKDPIRYDNMDRFQILRDIRLTLNPATQNTEGGSADTITTLCDFDELVRIPNLTSVYSGQSSPQTIADISTGALYFIARAEFDTTGTNEVGMFNSWARLRYKDV